MTVIPPLAAGLRTLPRRSRQQPDSFAAAVFSENTEGSEQGEEEFSLGAFSTPLTSLQTLNALAALTDDTKPVAPSRLAYGEKSPAPRRKTERRRGKSTTENYAGSERRRDDRRGKRG